MRRDKFKKHKGPAPKVEAPLIVDGVDSSEVLKAVRAEQRSLEDRFNFMANDAKRNFIKHEEPSIYLFVVRGFNKANHFFAVKLGDTAREVATRLSEWKLVYPNLELIGQFKAYVTDDETGERYYFRDYVLHEWLMNHGYIPVRKTHGASYERMIDALNLPDDEVVGEYVSNEFFVHAEHPEREDLAITVELIASAIAEFKANPSNFNLRPFFSARGNSGVRIDYRAQKPVSYAPFPYQRRAVTELVTKFVKLDKTSDNLRKVLLDSGTGSGKSNMFCWAVKALLGGFVSPDNTLTALAYSEKVMNKVFSNTSATSFSFVVLTSAYPGVFEEVRKAVETHTHFRDSMAYMSVSEFIQSDGKRLQELHEAGYAIVIMGVSLQNVAGRVTTPTSSDTPAIDITTDEDADAAVVRDWKKLHKLLAAQKIDLVLGDEAHAAMFGDGKEYKAALEDADADEASVDELDEVVRANGKRVFKFNPRLGYIFATATSEKILVQEIFDIDTAVVYVSWDEIDAQAEAENARYEAMGVPWLSPFYGKPRLHWFALDLDPKWLFETDKNKRLVRPDAAKAVWSAFFGVGEYVGMPSFMADSTIRAAGCGRHILIQLPYKVVSDQVEDILREIVGDEYDITNVSSARNPKNFPTENHIRQFMESHQFKKTIVLTVDKATTGLSINQWDTIVVARGGNSTTKRQQVYGRGFRTWVEEIDRGADANGDRVTEKVIMKPNTLIVDFCGEQVYEIMNQNEIDSSVLGEGGTDSGSNFRNVYGTSLENPESMEFYRLSRTDIHKQLDSCLRRDSIQRVVGRLKVTAKVKQYITTEMVLKLGVNEEGRKVVAQITERDDSGESHSRDLDIKSATDTDDGNNDNGSTTAADAEAKKAAKAAKEWAKLQDAFSRDIQQALLLLAVVREVDAFGKAFTSFDQLYAFINSDAGREVAGPFGLLRPVVTDFLDHVHDDRMMKSQFERSLKAIVARAGSSVDEFLKVVEELGRVSANEVFTPINVADLLVEKAGLASTNDGDNAEDVSSSWKKVLEGHGIIDNGDKSGVITHRLLEVGVAVLGATMGADAARAALVDKFWAVPTSPLAHEIVKSSYLRMSVPVSHIFFHDSISCLDMNRLLVVAIERRRCGAANPDSCEFHAPVVVGRGKKAEVVTDPALREAEVRARLDRAEQEVFGRIDEASDRQAALDWWKDVAGMVERFDYCISNPPYQLITSVREAANSNTVDIFDKFHLAALKFSHCSVMIYPAARWWLSERSLLRAQMIDGRLLHSMTFYNQVDSTELLFPGIGIADGVGIVVASDVNNTHYILESGRSGEKVDLKFDGIFYPLDVRMVKLAVKLHKVITRSGSLATKNNFKFIDNEAKIRGKRLEELGVAEWDGSDYDTNKLIKIYANASSSLGEKSKIYLIDRSEVPTARATYRVAMGYSLIKNETRRLRLLKFNPDTTYAGSAVGLDSFSTETEADNFYAYASTKVFEKALRTTIAGRKKQLGVFVPDLGDYTNNNPLFKSDEDLPDGHEYKGSDLDHRLYKLFNLTDEEIAVVEEA